MALAEEFTLKYSIVYFLSRQQDDMLDCTQLSAVVQRPPMPGNIQLLAAYCPCEQHNKISKDADRVHRRKTHRRVSAIHLSAASTA